LSIQINTTKGQNAYVVLYTVMMFLYKHKPATLAIKWSK